MLIVPDEALFHHQYHNDTNGEAFARKVDKAVNARWTSDTDPLVCLDAEVARIAGDINRLLVPRNLKDFRKQVMLADYLAKQTVIVPLSLGYLMRTSTGPITPWSIDATLRKWGFESIHIKSTIKKGKRIRTGKCFVKVTFERL